MSKVNPSLLPKYLGQLEKFRRDNPRNPIYDKLPIKPHPRQREFLNLTCEEALFGGAAGGGKSETLLMWLAEGIDIPTYTGAIYRRYIEDLVEGNSSILAKSMRLYPPLGGSLVGLEWRFPSGACIVMSGIAFEKSVLKAQGKEFHRVAFDELTHFTEPMYDFIYTTRMRKVVGFPITLGVRGSANPGGPGHDWVKNRFITPEALAFSKERDVHEKTPPGTIFWNGPDVAYVPSRVVDNPSLDMEDYLRRMRKNKNPVELARMMNGDWAATPEGLIKPHWLRYFTMRDRMVDLLVSRPDGDGGVIHTKEVLRSFHEGQCRRFVTVDTAGGMKDMDEAAKEGNSRSWTVAGVWDHIRLGDSQALILRYVWRARAGFVEVGQQLVSMYERWHPHRIRVEDKTMGPNLYNILRHKIPIDLIPSGTIDKVSRATTLLHMLDRGQVYLPADENSWRPTLEAEWLSWQGLSKETNDQIDMSAYAAIEAGGDSGGVVKLEVAPSDAMTLSPSSGSRLGSSGWL